MSIDPIENIDKLTLGGPSESFVISTSEANRLAATAMVRQATRELSIVSRDLDARVYDNQAFVEAVKALVLGSRRSRVRVLLRDVTPIVKRGHRLLELCRRLPTYMQIRSLAKEHESYNSAFLVADQVGTVFRTYADRYEATVSFNDPPRAGELTNQFNEMWEPAHAPAGLGRLSV